MINPLNILIFESWSMIMQYLVSFVGLFITAYFAYYFGVRAYFKQKEYEMVKERYLNQSLDIICANLDNSLSEFRDAWSQSFANINLLKNLGDTSNIDLYNLNINRISQKNMGIQPSYRLKHIIGSDIFWNAVQLAYGFIIVSMTFIDQDLNATIKLYLKEDSPIRKEKRHEIFVKYHNRLVDMDNDSKKYYVVLSFLLRVSEIVECERLSFKELSELHKNKEIVKLVENLKELFADEFAQKLGLPKINIEK